MPDAGTRELTPAAGVPIADHDRTPVLTPAQERTLAVLRRSGDAIEFDPGEITALKTDARDAIAGATARLGDDDRVDLNKHHVWSVLGCETLHMHNHAEPFAWTPINARGSVAHKAIELMVNWRGQPEPAELVDEAIDRLASDQMSSIGDWLVTLSPGDEAELRGTAVESVTQFMDSFPPLEARWRPMTESRMRWPVDGSIQLRGKPDLVIGPPRGRESTKVFIDLKTGRRTETHAHDLRYYALLQTLIHDVPPRRLASFYLDAGEAVVEDVTMPLLRSALLRTLHALDLTIELHCDRRPPTTSPGPRCRWCPLIESCDAGKQWVHDDDSW